MKKLKYFIVLFVILAGIIAVLFSNKSKMQAKAKNEKIDAYAVSVEQVKKSNASSNLVLVGTIAANNDVAVVSEASGKVVGVNAEVGDYKNKGSLLIQLDDEIKQAAFKTAEINYQKAKKDYERYTALLNQESVTNAQLENIKLALQTAEAQYIIAQREYNDTKVKSPISGIVTSRSVNVGDYVNKSLVVANVVDISKLKVKLNVAENDVFNLKVGDSVKVSTDVYPGITFNGKIETISDKGDAAHTYPVEVIFSNSKKYPLKAGMFGTVAFNFKSKTEKLLMPRDALIGSVKNPKVFAIENGIAVKKDIVVGNSFGDEFEVLSGLKEGDNVVVNGQNNLADNYKVMIVK